MARHPPLGSELAVPVLHQRILRRRLVHHVADPRVPARFNVPRVVVVLGVLDPARAQRELLLVLEELVARAVGADQGAGFGVADVLEQGGVYP